MARERAARDPIERLRRHTLEAALWCIDRSDDFAQAVLLAANLADDADTVAAVTGQIAGALWGLTGIRHDWLDRLAWRDRLENTALLLIAARQQVPVESSTDRVPPAAIRSSLALRYREARTSMKPPKWVAVSRSSFEWEHEALEFLRAHLPDHEP